MQKCGFCCIKPRINRHSNIAFIFIYISDMPDEDIRKMHMIPSHSLSDALDKAKEIIGRDDVKIAIIPDGVSVIVEK